MNRPAGAGASQPGLLYGGAEASTTGSGDAIPAVMLAPVSVAVTPDAPVRLSVEVNARSCVDAAALLTHGPRWLTVPAPGPSLPADVATNTPAA